MPRGRPKGSKNKSTLLKVNLLEPDTNQVVENNLSLVKDEDESVIDVKKEVLPKNSFVCEICQKVVIGNSYPLDFNRITGKADYYRESRSKKLSVCNECSKELSKVIDLWLLKKNPKLRKFPLGDMYEEEM